MRSSQSKRNEQVGLCSFSKPLLNQWELRSDCRAVFIAATEPVFMKHKRLPRRAENQTNGPYQGPVNPQHNFTTCSTRFIFVVSFTLYMSRHSIVGMGCEVWSSIPCRYRRSRQAVRPTQLPIQWVRRKADPLTSI